MASIERRLSQTDLSRLTAPVLSAEDGDDFRRGAQLFNDGLYWESHEAWELIWRRHPEQSRIFFQGLIQVAAGFHQIERGIVHGADKHLRNALWKLKPFRPVCLGVDVSSLVVNVEAVLKQVRSADPAQVSRICETLPAIGLERT